MQKGDIVSIEFTGKDASTGKIFDTTDKEIAQKNGIFGEKQRYGPFVISVGNGELLAGLDLALQTMHAGESKTVALKAKDAFGERDLGLVKVLPLNEFKKHNVSAVPGTVVNVNDMHGRVQSVSGGRVRVDFNPELAGRDLEYTLKIVKAFTTNEEKVHALAQKFFTGWEKPNVKITGEKVEVHVTAKEIQFVQRGEALFAKNMMEAIPTIKKVEMVRSYASADFKGMEAGMQAGAEEGMEEGHGHYHEDGSYHQGQH